MFFVENFDEVCNNTPAAVQKDNYPPTNSQEEGAFFLFTSIFIIYEHNNLTHTLCCCPIKAKALCSSFICFRFCTKS